jgi:hypothetical protein
MVVWCQIVVLEGPALNYSHLALCPFHLFRPSFLFPWGHLYCPAFQDDQDFDFASVVDFAIQQHYWGPVYFAAEASAVELLVVEGLVQVFQKQVLFLDLKEAEKLADFVGDLLKEMLLETMPNLWIENCDCYLQVLWAVAAGEIVVVAAAEVVEIVLSQILGHFAFPFPALGRPFL